MGGVYTPRPENSNFNEKLELEREEMLQSLKDQTALLLAKLIGHADVNIPIVTIPHSLLFVSIAFHIIDLFFFIILTNSSFPRNENWIN